MVIWIYGLGVENWRNLLVTSLRESSSLFSVQCSQYNSIWELDVPPSYAISDPRPVFNWPWLYQCIIIKSKAKWQSLAVVVKLCFKMTSKTQSNQTKLDIIWRENASKIIITLEFQSFSGHCWLCSILFKTCDAYKVRVNRKPDKVRKDKTN